jgi:2-oxoglutarate ferredoxin oxidoreductase subunit beta
MDGLTRIVEEAIRYPGFSFVNVQSPCVSFGDAENQMKVQKAKMKKLSDLGHDPTNRLRAMELAQDYGTALYTGVFYRDPNPPPTYGSQIAELQGKLAAANGQPMVAATPIEN